MLSDGRHFGDKMRVFPGLGGKSDTFFVDTRQQQTQRQIRQMNFIFAPPVYID